MAPRKFVSFPLCTFTTILNPKTNPTLHGLLPINRLPCPVRWMSAAKNSDETIVRRSVNLKPSSFDYDFIQSLTSEYKGKPYASRFKELKEEVKIMLQSAANTLDQIETIDALQRLGVAYHFEDEIESVLKFIYTNNHYMKLREDLHATALEFRLLRQQGYHVPQEVFNSFMDEEGQFKSSLCSDVKGVLNLYEASYLSIRGENILEKAREVATKNLKKYTHENNDEYSKIVRHALELPLDWRMQWLEARWYINVYENTQTMNPIILQLSKLNFNMVQAVHLEDLKHSNSWWKKIGLCEKLGNYVRNRPIETFYWAVGAAFEFPFGYSRRILAKVGLLITLIDDIYDAYATLEELQLFTCAIERWDTTAMDELPHYMKIYFLALHNLINEMGMDILQEQDLHIIPYLRKTWVDLCKAYLKEAKWCHSGYKPSLEEYLENAWISISGPTLMVHVYFSLTNQITFEGMKSIQEYHNIIRFSSMIARLTNDLGTASHELERVDVPKAMQCYMHETGVSEEEARRHIGDLINEYWKKLNEEYIGNTLFTQTYIRFVKNLGRTAHCVYDNGDGYGAQNSHTKQRILSLFTQSIPLDHIKD